MGKSDIIVDAKIRDQIFPLSPAEREQLERNIKADGEIYAPVIAWKEEGILLDGHNRKEIGDALGVGYRVKELSFSCREDAEDWVDGNQLGRRNLNPDQMSLLRGRIYNRTKNLHGGDRRDGSSAQNAHLKNTSKTAEKLASEHGVSAGTIRRDGEFADAVEKIKAVDKDIEKKVAGGKAKKSKVVKAAKLVDKEPEKAKAALADELPADEPKPAAPEVDRVGTPIEQKYVADAFAYIDTANTLMRDISSLKTRFASMCDSAAGVYAVRSRQQFEADAKSLRGIVRFCTPYAVCPLCGGRKCASCKNSGWMGEEVYKLLPKEVRGEK